MELTKTIQSKSEIIDALQQSFQSIATFIKDIPDEKLKQRMNGKWSIAENLQHLILSNKPVAAVIKRNKWAFLSFGISLNGSETFDTLKTNYHLKLSQGSVPTSAFVPQKDEDISKTTLLKNWNTIQEKYPVRLAKWSEKDLDRFRIPHPLLGKLTFREMLFFSVFHNEHHLKAMKVCKENF